MMFVRAWVLLGVEGGTGVAQTPTVNQEPVELPVYGAGTVDPLPPSRGVTPGWGFEVLGRFGGADPALGGEFQRFHHAISLVWPVGHPNASPGLLVLCEDSLL
jgi:hypothetical protein